MTKKWNAFLPRMLVLAMLIFCVPISSMAGTVKVQGLRTWQAPDNTRIVLDLSASADYHMFRMSKPDRLVIDLKSTSLPKNTLIDVPKSDPLLKKVRTGVDKKRLRVVLDLHQQVNYTSFQLKPYQGLGHRLVIDLTARVKQQKAVVRKQVVMTKPTGQRDVVVAIDAGHGGEDPGALGYKRTREKDVVLAIAKKLAVLIEKEPGMKPLLIRKGDYYLSLRKRTRIAREQKADLFVSIHADAFKDKRVKGLSVYVLSQNGATDEAARFLADKENASDMIGGVKLEDADDALATMLLDLSQEGTRVYSHEAANAMLRELKGLGKPHKRTVQQAGFAVLKSPDIPSILIETAFISNPSEERKLRSKTHQQAMARSMLKGIRGYFVKTTPPGTLFASYKHVIERGDTLSDIAQQYRVSVAQLKKVNQLRNDGLRIGTVLRIPMAREG